MAATVFELVKASPYSAVYRITGGGDPGALNFAGADLASLAAGPLKVEIGRRAAVGTLGECNVNGTNSPRVRIYMVTAVNDAQATPTAYTLTWTGTGLAATLLGPGEGPAEELYVEIRFIHSRKR